jgi:integrase
VEENVAAAWEQDEDWGTLVWLVMVTGMRRAELLALRWSDIDLPSGKVGSAVAPLLARPAAAP